MMDLRGKNWYKYRGQVSTAGGHDKEENGEMAGSLFKINVGIKGKPEFLSDIKF